jgi:GNAT superfamily N-acetyltransferase
MEHTKIIRLRKLPPGRLGELVGEAERTDYRFPRRLVEEWDCGVNRFDGPGEALFAAVIGGKVIGVCGLNADPYAEGRRIGRVRRLYVLAAYRRRGIGRRLVTEVVAAARGVFDVLRLRTQEPGAAAFYESLGFRSSLSEPDCTHILNLALSRQVPSTRV